MAAHVEIIGASSPAVAPHTALAGPGMEAPWGPHKESPTVLVTYKIKIKSGRRRTQIKPLKILITRLACTCMRTLPEDGERIIQKD